MKYTNKPEFAKTIVAKLLLESMQKDAGHRELLLQNLGDQCLLFAGLFPKQASSHHVKISYFVGMGRSAYQAISHATNDVFNSLALQFVLIMDVLQSVPKHAELMPLEAYEQWTELGSQRAYRILKSYRH